MILNKAKRDDVPDSEFAGEGETFPINDANHARLAVGGATRSEHAGNISPSQAQRIKAKAHAMLAKLRKK